MMMALASKSQSFHWIIAPRTQRSPDFLEALEKLTKSAHAAHLDLQTTLFRSQNVGVVPPPGIEELIVWSLRDEHFDSAAHDRIEKANWS